MTGYAGTHIYNQPFHLNLPQSGIFGGMTLIHLWKSLRLDKSLRLYHKLQSRNTEGNLSHKLSLWESPEGTFRRGGKPRGFYTLTCVKLPTARGAPLARPLP
nr:MAG TPA: hypothetical protein [Microviridae sp.]